MSWRVVTVVNRCKLEYKLGFLVSRGEQTIKVHLSEIAVLIIENTAVSITASLLSELIQNKVKIIFCDEKHNPISELMATSLRYDTSGQLFRQVDWNSKKKQQLWTTIIEQKIANQRDLLSERCHTKEASMLDEYLAELQLGDVTNREGHAAKVYFNALFGLDFTRQKLCYINSALDYGYTILLSAVNRAIAIQGYSPNLGIWHHNEFNHFNLGCDLMEPLRVLVDKTVLQLDFKEFNTDCKHKLQQIFNCEVYFSGRRYALGTVLPLYVKSLADSLDQDISPVFIKLYDV